MAQNYRRRHHSRGIAPRLRRLPITSAGLTTQFGHTTEPEVREILGTLVALASPTPATSKARPSDSGMMTAVEAIHYGFKKLTRFN